MLILLWNWQIVKQAGGVNMVQKTESPAGKQGQSVNLQNKDNDFRTQYQIVYQSFHGTPKTMLQTSIETGILRANICRYIAEMLERDQIQVIHFGLCPLTKFRAGFYSTDPALFSQSSDNQLNLFENGI